MSRSSARLLSPIATLICVATVIQLCVSRNSFAAPVAALTSVRPSSAIATGTGFPILVDGSNFTGACKLLWNGSPVSCTFVSSGELKGYVSAPMIASPGVSRITVANINGAASNSEAFTVTSAPKISALKPAEVKAAASAFTLTVTGSNFYRDSQITWRGQPVATTYVSASRLTTRVSAAMVATAGAAQVGVSQPSGVSGGALTFSISPHAVVQVLKPESALAGSAAFTLTVTGANFDSGSTVTWNGSPMATTYVSSTQLQASIPADAIASAGAVKVGTIDPSGSTGTPAQFDVKAQPSISSLSPASATATASGFNMAVNGSNFVGGYLVTWNGQPISTSFVSSGQLTGYVTKTMLAGVGTATVQVAAPNGVVSNTQPFSINGVASLSSISPTGVVQGSHGVTLAVNGSGFTSAWTVQYNGAALVTKYVSPTSLTAIVPAAELAAAGVYGITIAGPDGVVTQSVPFSVFVQPSATSLWSQKLVWAHCLPHEVYSESAAAALGLYGDMYPLELQSMPASASPALDIKLAQADGIDAFAFDIFTGGSNADDYLNAADANGHFLIAPCLDLTILFRNGDSASQMEDAIVRGVEEYARDASTHPSAARDGKALVVFTYALAMPLSNWQDALNRIAADGFDVSWVADMQKAYHGVQTFPKNALEAYESVFGNGYVWAGLSGWLFDDSVTQFQSDNHNFVASMYAGADRPGAGTYSDARGTERMRDTWADQATSECNWIELGTWNDFQEMSSVNLSSDWNSTRWDLDQWYAAAFKGNPAPFTNARLYITTPKAVALGQRTNAEALVINPTSAPVCAYVQLFDGSGAAMGPVASTTISAGAVGAVDAPVMLTSVPAGGFLRAKAWATDAYGNPIERVIGAPTGVFANVSSSQLRIDYYSIPASSALPESVELSLSPSATPGQLTAAITAPTGANVLFADLIANTTLISDSFEQTPAPMDVPDTPGTFYVARVIDQNLMVSYSNPVYVGP